MNRRDAVLTIPTAIAAVALKLKANPTSAGLVHRSGLREVIRLWDESEALAADIRRRLEAGATLEPGELGVSTWAHDAVTTIGGGGTISIGGVDIDSADYYRQFRSEHPELAGEIWA